MMTYRTNAEWLHAEAEKAGIPLRTLDQVKKCLLQARETKADISMARLMLRAGRLTNEAKAYVASEYPQ